MNRRKFLMIFLVFLLFLNKCHEKNKNIDIKCDYCTELQNVILREDLGKVKILIDQGGNPNEQNKIGFKYSLIYWSIYKKNFKITKFLIENGANIDFNLSGYTPLHCASDSESFDICKLLLEYKINVNLLDNKFETPLHIAARKGNYKIFKLLMDNGADFKIKHELGDSVIQKAVIGGNIDIVRLLIKIGANVNTSNSIGFSPLFESIYYKRIEISKLLLDNHANLKQLIKHRDCDWDKLNLNICFDVGDNDEIIALKVGNNEYMKLRDNYGKKSIIIFLNHVFVFNI